MAGYIKLSSVHVLLWVSIGIQLSSAAQQINCTTGQAVEGKQYQLHCTGFNAAAKVEWRRSFQQSGGGDGVIASCDDVNICNVIDGTRHIVSRTTGNTSSLTILKVQRDDDIRWRWTCLSGAQTSSCKLPSTVYLPELSTNCTAELTLGGPVARCRIQKVYPVPECTWLESITSSTGAKEVSSNTTIPPSSSEAQIEALSSFRDDVDDTVYFTATCVLRRNVTYIEGNYSYTAIISPGSDSRNVQFVGLASVVAPSTPTLVDCSSSYIQPSQEVVCTCRVSNLGWPRGHVMWFDQWGRVIRTGQNNSVQLVRGDVVEKRINRTYTCTVRSTDNFLHSADYLPQFAFGPDSVRITGPSSFIADDRSPVTLTCTAFGVKPQPSFTWQGQGQDFQISSANGGDEPLSYQESIAFFPDLTEKSVVVTCFVRNSQFNLSYLSSASFTIPFISNFRNNCSCDSGEPSESKELCSLVVASVSGGLGLGCLVLVVTLIVLCCRSRKQQKLDKTGQTPPTPHTFHRQLPQVGSHRGGVSSPDDISLYSEIDAEGQAPKHQRAAKPDRKGCIPMGRSDCRPTDASQETGNSYERLRQPAPANQASTASEPLASGQGYRDSSPQTLAPPPPTQGRSKARKLPPVSPDQPKDEQPPPPPKAHTPSQVNNMYLQVIPDHDPSVRNHSLTADAGSESGTHPYVNETP